MAALFTPTLSSERTFTGACDLLNAVCCAKLLPGRKTDEIVHNLDGQNIWGILLFINALLYWRN